MAKAKSIAKSDFVERNLEAGLEKLTVAATAGAQALAVRTRDGKKLTVTVKRLAKRRASLLKRKTLAAKRAKKTPSGDTRKALSSAVRELAATSKLLDKARASKSDNATELAALKLASRRATGYAKAIAQIDRQLGK